jgi:hypothetical protein
LLIKKKNQVEDLKKENEAKDSENKILQKQLDDLTAETESFRVEREELLQKEKESRTEKETPEKEREILNTEADTTDEQNDLPKSKSGVDQPKSEKPPNLITSVENTKLRTDFDELRRNYELLSNDHTDLSTKHDQNCTLMSQQLKENNELATNLRLKEEQNCNLEIKVNDVQKLACEKDNEILRLSSKLDSLKEELDKNEQHKTNQEQQLHDQNEDFVKKSRLIEEQLSQTAQQKEQLENDMRAMKQRTEDLIDEIEKLKETNISFMNSELQAKNELMQNASNPLEPSLGACNDSESELEILRQQLEEQHVEMTNLETNLKSEVSDLQQSAESQEQLISKLEHDNMCLRKQVSELNQTVISHEDTLKSLTNENNNLSNQLHSVQEHNEEIFDSTDSISQKEKEKTEDLLRIYQQEIETYKGKLNSQDSKVCAALKTKDQDMSSLENQIVVLQASLDAKSRDYKSLHTECARLRKYKEQELSQQDEQESYLLHEIERVQHDSKHQLNSMEEKKDREIAELARQHEDKLLEIELEYEQLKSSELEHAQEDFKTQLDSLVAQRTQLMIALKKMETLLLLQKHSNGFDTSHTENGENGLYQHLMQSILSLTNHNTVLDNTWPQISQSGGLNGTRRLSCESTTPFIREQLEKAKEDICQQMKDLDNILLGSSSLDNRLSSSLNESFNGSIFDSEDGIGSRSIHSSSPIPYSKKQIQSPVHSPFKDSGLSTDSSVGRNSFHEKQLKELIESFNRLERQCHSLENEGVQLLHESWYKDLQSWKHRANSRLRLLEHRLLGSRNDSALMSAILFRPSDEEVQEIIADVNKKYDCYKQREV